MASRELIVRLELHGGCIAVSVGNTCFADSDLAELDSVERDLLTDYVEGYISEEMLTKKLAENERRVIAAMHKEDIRKG